MYALLRTGFVHDLVGALLVTVLAGSIAAAAVSAAADRFFEDTVSGIVGDYGEYHMIVHVRQEARPEATRAMGEMLRRDFPGARMKQSVTVLSRANFFVSLPRISEAEVTRLAKAVTDTPGFAGYTLVLEPKVTVSGIGARAAPIIRPRLAAIEGVNFILKDGGNMHLVCDSADSARAVAQTAETILRGYHLADVRLGAGASAGDRKSLVDAVIAGNASVSQVHDVTMDSAAQEARELGAALQEMKRFLEAWAPQAVIALEGGEVGPDDSLVMSAAPRRRGAVPEEDDVRVAVTRVSDSEARALVISPDTNCNCSVDRLIAYSLDGETIGARVGVGRLVLPEQELARSLSEADVVLRRLSEASDAMLYATQGWESALSAYESALDSMILLQRALERFGVEIPEGSGRSGARIDAAAVSSIAELTARALEAVRDLQAAAEAVSILTSHYDPLLANLSLWQSRLESFWRKLQMVHSAAEGAEDVAAVLDDMSAAAAGILSTLQELDATALGEQLQAARSDLDDLADLDVAEISKQLTAVQSSLPDFSGEGTVRSIKLIDGFLQEQQESSGKIELLVESGKSDDELVEAIQKAAPAGAAVYVLPPGVVQPGVKSEVQTLLRSVRATISGLTACAVVAVSLILDHATVIAGARAVSRHGAVGYGRDTAARLVYGALVGAFLLGAIAAITRATLASLGSWVFALLGAAMGFAAAWAAPRLAPVDSDEVEACIAMGLSHTEIMREIILPSGKPGVFSLLNRPRQVFRDSRPSRRRSQGGMAQCSQYAT